MMWLLELTLGITNAILENQGGHANSKDDVLRKEAKRLQMLDEDPPVSRKKSLRERMTDMEKELKRLRRENNDLWYENRRRQNDMEEMQGDIDSLRSDE